MISLYEDVELTTRSFNCLNRASITTLGQLNRLTDKELSKIKGLGKKSISEIRNETQNLKSLMRIMAFKKQDLELIEKEIDMLEMGLVFRLRGIRSQIIKDIEELQSNFDRR